MGLSHKSAPVAVREKVALGGEELKQALSDLRERSGVGEVMVVSTCNRVECYVYGDAVEPARAFFLERTSEAAGHLYERSGREAVRHLFRVASSLDSMVVGEPQILGQVKEAYGLAASASTAGAFVSRLCNRAFATAKRVRNETEIAKGAGSVSQVAVELVEKIFGDLRGRSVLLVGAGKMGALSAKALRELGCDRILVTNRSPERARALAAEIGAVAEPWEGLVSLLALSDVVIVSTGAPTYVITRELAAQVMKVRRGRSICFIDVAVPRNVDPACSEQDNVYAYDIDDLQKVVTQTHAARAEEAIRAEAIVEAEVMTFSQERETRAALPVLAELRRRAEQIARAEAERTLSHVGGKLDEKGRRSVEAMAQAIVNKLLHGPTARLKEAAASGDSDLPGAAAELFGMGETENPSPRRATEPGPGAAANPENPR
ncbi:MAG TPA: glutamyl-tRNA reductase [Anaeromyxobacteraceae bacterium]|nr:glutamyl-tRNA reductase [Anaeromyxobacteraceae bacterium]